MNHPPPRASTLVDCLALPEIAGGCDAAGQWEHHEQCEQRDDEHLAVGNRIGGVDPMLFFFSFVGDILWFADEVPIWPVVRKTIVRLTFPPT